uniref:Uncharacterized protein LOC111103141 isoform X1 n=1 Tax=Crassostrea virginica TaxID=6565 RepID=A0A8B8AL68_CRAVI|nr:uncharacterized protein LOC111103141 isoform X1 [Crassostrea virginica]
MGNSLIGSTNTQDEIVQNKTESITSSQILNQRDENEDAPNADGPDDQQIDAATEKLYQILQSIREQYGDEFKSTISSLKVTKENAFGIFVRIAKSLVRKIGIGFSLALLAFLIVLAACILMAVEKKFGIGKAVVDFSILFMHKVANYINGEANGEVYTHRELVAHIETSIIAAIDAAVPQSIA